MGAEYSIEYPIEPAIKPAIKPAIEPATEPAIEPEPSIEPSIEPSTEPAVAAEHSTPKKRYLTRNEGVQILVFQRLGMIYETIAKQFRNVSPYQVERVIHKGHPTPTHSSIYT